MSVGNETATSGPSTHALVRPAKFLTLVALLPQALFLLLSLTDGEASWIAPAAAFAYAAFVFSFVGGVWWGVELIGLPQRPLVYFIAVQPMLISFALFMPWLWGWSWPGPQLVILGLAIMCSVLVDWRVIGSAIMVPGWLGLRIIASLGLGLATLAIGLVTLTSR